MWYYGQGLYVQEHNPRPEHRFSLNQQLQHYDPDLQHLRHWLPTLEDLNTDAILRHQSGEHLLTGYPSPVVSVPHSDAT